MVVQYPSYAIPQPGNFLGAVNAGYDFAGKVGDDHSDKQSLAALADYAQQLQRGAGGQSPTMAAQPASSIQSLSDLDPNGRPIAVADRAADLRYSTGAGPAPAQGGQSVPNGYVTNLAQAESSGNSQAVNAASGATGLYQFLPSTWSDLAQRHPELGLTQSGITDPAQQQRAIGAFTSDNAKSMAAEGVPVTPQTLFAAHQLGAGGVAQLMKAPPGTPMTSVFPDAAAANPQWQGMTVGDYQQHVAQQSSNGAGYQPPMAPQPGGQAPGLSTAGGVPQGAGLPDRDTLLALLRAPSTRGLAQQMIQAAQAGQSPAGLLDMAYKRAQINAVGLPSGYARNPDGTMQAVTGGPEDPSNPLNALKLPFGMTSGGGAGAAGGGPAPVGVGPDGNPDPTQQARFLQGLSPQAAALVHGVANYQLDPAKVESVRQRAGLLSLVQQYDPTFDMSQYAARASMKKSLASGALQSQLASVNTTIQHLNDLAGQADALGNAGGIWTPINGLKNAGEAAVGNPAQTTFRQTAQAVADEASKVFKGSGASDVETIRGWQSSLPENGSPEQLHAAILNLATKLLPARLDTLQQQYSATMGGRQLPGFLTPQSIAALKNLGVDPTILDPVAGATEPQSTAPQPATAITPPATPQQAAPVTKSIGGVTYVQDGNGDWYEQD